MTFPFVKFSFYFLLSHNFIAQRYGKKSSPSPSSIVDGDLADENEFRYIVAIRRESYDFHGGGSIIHPEWIITARHVVVEQYDDPESDYFNLSAMETLYVYPKFHNNLTRFYRKFGYRVKNLYCHPFSDDIELFSTDSDIALVQLEYPIPLGPESYYKFEYIDLNFRFLDFQRTQFELIAAGWGMSEALRLNDSDQNRNYDLRKATYRSIPVSMRQYPEFRPFQQFSMLNPKQGVCDGDSGGPIVIRNPKSGKDVQVGIISYAPIDCDGPSLQQNIMFYQKWIVDIIQGGGSEEILQKYSCSNLYGKEYNNWNRRKFSRRLKQRKTFSTN